MSDTQDFVIENGVLIAYNGPGGDVIIPEGVTEIKGGDTDLGPEVGEPEFYDGVFCENKTVKSVVFPNSLKVIGPAAFYDSGLTSVTLPEGTTTIGDYAFSDCESLTSVTIPESVKEIGLETFSGCSKLESMTIWVSSLCELDSVFGYYEKTIPMILLQPGKEPLRTMAVFRRTSFKKWSYEKDFLIPLDAEDFSLYDTLLATGERDGFKISKDKRVLAILWRLLDKEHPIEQQIKNMFVAFLSGQIGDVLKCALKDGEPAYIRTLRDLGGIPAEKLPKLKKDLAASEDPAFSQLAAELDAPAPVTEAAADAAGSHAEASVLERLRQLKAQSVLTKYNLMALPDIPLAEGGEPAPKEYLQLILAEYIEHLGWPYKGFCKTADEIAAKLDRTALQRTLGEIYEMQSNKTREAILTAVFRYADGATVSKLYHQRTVNERTKSVIEKALLLSDTREAMLLADKRNCLDDYARMRGTDANTLRDTVLTEFGLDADGKKTYDLGGNTVTVTMAQDLTLALYDHNAKKTVKSLPKRGADLDKYAAAQADFSEMKKNLKKAVKGHCDRLLQNFLSGSTRQAEDWKSLYLNNPTLRQVASLLIWSQNGKTFTLREGTAIDSNGQLYVINSKPIKTAHPMEMEPGDVSAWRKYFNDHALEQPFVQLWEPVMRPETIREDRYSGVSFPAYRFKDQEKHGISFDFSYSAAYLKISIQGCKLGFDPGGDGGAVGRHSLNLNGTVTLGKFTFAKYTRQVNHIVALLDKWTITERIMKDDTSAVDFLDSATLAQIMEYLALAAENEKTNVAAALLDYKNKCFPNLDPLAKFALEDL